MRLLVLTGGLYATRILEHLRRFAPPDWEIAWAPAPTGLPVVIDDPEDHLPQGLPPADLILFLPESERAAQLLPALAARTGAGAVLAPVDDAAWIRPGMRAQLQRELAALGVAVAFPQPFCALSEDGLDPLLQAFARRFGRPRLRVRLDPATRHLAEVEVERGSPCGSTHFAAERARGLAADAAVPHAGLICLHYPCMASMQPTRTEAGVETLMHTSGQIFNEELARALRRAGHPAPPPDSDQHEEPTHE